METIRICKDRNLLREFLESREKEVVSIMMTLFDEERIRRNYAASERREAVRDAVENMLKTGKMSIEEIAGYFTELLICIIFEKFRASCWRNSMNILKSPMKRSRRGIAILQSNIYYFLVCPLQFKRCLCHFSAAYVFCQ